MTLEWLIWWDFIVCIKNIIYHK